MSHTAMKLLTATMAALALSSCFTGIESTPRITGDDVRHAGVTLTDEQRLGIAVTSQPPSHWVAGKQWIVRDNRIAIIFNPPATDTLLNDTLALVALNRVPTIMGDTAVELMLSSRGRVFNYPTGVSARDLASRRSLEIPFAVELSPIAQVDSLLRGNTYYIKTPQWTDAAGSQYSGLRHIPVTVTRVEAGTVMRPLRVWFVRAGDSTEYSVLLTYGEGITSTRNFDYVFSFTNPRNEYPSITDATWDNIIHSQVAVGMSRDECRLALGAPTRLQRGLTTAAQVEHWSYDDGTYLIFEDGVLTRYRK